MRSGFTGATLLAEASAVRPTTSVANTAWGVLAWQRAIEVRAVVASEMFRFRVIFRRAADLVDRRSAWHH